MSAVIQPIPSVEPRRTGLKVLVRGLEVQAAIGVYDHEYHRLQPLFLDVELDLGAAPVRELSDTLDYDFVAAIARDLAAGEHIQLVETFAEKVALACFDHPRVQAVRVRVEKPDAIPAAAAAGCEVSYSR